jgi:hypothetical protein
MSVLAFYLCLVALAMYIITIKLAGVFYFKTTAIIVCIGMLIVNDYLRLYGSIPQASWGQKLGLYAFYIAICTLGVIISKRHCKDS